MGRSPLILFASGKEKEARIWSDGITAPGKNRIDTGFTPLPKGRSEIRHQRPRYSVIFLKRKAPITVIARLKPPITAKQTTGLIWDTPVRPYRIPSTP